MHSDGSFVGRSAPEIDIFEATVRTAMSLPVLNLTQLSLRLNWTQTAALSWVKSPNPVNLLYVYRYAFDLQGLHITSAI